MKATKTAGSHLAMLDAVAAEQQQQRDSDHAENIHQRRTDRSGGHRTQVGTEQPPRRAAEAGDLPVLHVKGFDDAVAGDGLVQDVLHFGQFVLSAAASCAAPASRSCARNR